MAGDRMTSAEYRALVAKEQPGRQAIAKQRRRRQDAMPELLWQQMALGGIPPPEKEYRFAKPRRWRFDFAWPNLKIACEYEGLHSDKSGHTTVRGYESDLEKYNAATLAGWRVYRFSAAFVRDGRAFATLDDAIRRACR